MGRVNGILNSICETREVKYSPSPSMMNNDRLAYLFYTLVEDLIERIKIRIERQCRTFDSCNFRDESKMKMFCMLVLQLPQTFVIALVLAATGYSKKNSAVSVSAGEITPIGNYSASQHFSM